MKSIKLLLVELGQNGIMVFQGTNNFTISISPFVADGASLSDTFFENHDGFSITFAEIHSICVVCIVYYSIFDSFVIFAVIIKIAK